MNPLEKPRTGELPKKDMRLERYPGEKKQERITFQQLCEEKVGFNWVKGQSFGGFKFSAGSNLLSLPCDHIALLTPPLRQDFTLSATNTELLTPCIRLVLQRSKTNGRYVIIVHVCVYIHIYNMNI